MAAKPRKSVVQNIIKNLLESEIPEIQNASKELADWIKQLEQHSFKLQHYATEIESWASEEEEGDTIELTDLIKDLETTLNDMRQTGALPPQSAPSARSALSAPSAPSVPSAPAVEGPAVSVTEDRMLRGYGRSGRVLRPRELPRAEFRADDGRVPVKRVEKPVEEDKTVDEPARTPQGVLLARDSVKPGVKAELPTAGKEVAVRREGKEPAEEEPGKSSYVTPEGFRVRRMR
jgi:hypothetical protein